MTELYYFSATGNSLSTARLLAEELGDARLVPIASLENAERVPVTADCVGFVFPIFNSDLPYIFRHVIPRMEFTGQPYIFNVCTYGGRFGEIAGRTDKLLRSCGQKLSINLPISLPGNARITSDEHNEKTLAAQRENVHKIALSIKERVFEDYSRMELPAPSPYEENGFADLRGLTADESCTGCGTCVSICPVNNITIKNGRAVMGAHCLSCLACFHWCPGEAIYQALGGDISRRPKYHHPDVTAEDIAAQQAK